MKGLEPISASAFNRAAVRTARTAHRLGEAGHAYVRDHLNVERMADAYRRLYAELLIRTARNGR